jgi:hypothetical protein
MKRLLLSILFVLILSTPVHAFRDWSVTDRSLFAANLVVASVDFYQTIQFQRFDGAIVETNPFSKPLIDDPVLLAASWASFYAVEYLIMDHWPSLRKFLPFQLGYHVALVVNNRHLLLTSGGVRIPF